MKIGIHHQKGSYSEGWIAYCEEKKIPFKIVNAYSSDIVKDLVDCDAFMWHHHQAKPKDVLFAKQLLFSLEQAGKIVYPDWKTGWHFDDKLGQKYLLEALDLPLVPTFIFYTKSEATNWVLKQKYPIVFKLRGGASSYNVRLVRSKKEAIALIKKSFGKGHRCYNPWVHIKETFRKYLLREASLWSFIKSFVYLFFSFPIERSKSREKGYVLFQHFIPDCPFDIRVQVAGNKAYAMKREVRKNDFRASGSGKIDFDGFKIPEDLIKKSFEITKKLEMQTLAIDFVPYKSNYLIVELSYAWGIAKGELDYGYWNSQLKWHKGKINLLGWIVDVITQTILEKRLNMSTKNGTTSGN